MALEAFEQQYPAAAAVDAISYPARNARHLAKIRDYYEIPEPAGETLAANGFVVLDQAPKPYGLMYEEAFHAHLPVVVTADAMLYAFHRSYDDILIEVETEVAMVELASMLDGLHRGLEKRRSLPPKLEAAADDLDVFLTVAQRLLGTAAKRPARAHNAKRVSDLVRMVKAERPHDAAVIGESMKLDFSMYKPRGHYTQSPALKRYFRAMAWVGRIPFRALRTTEVPGTMVLDRQSADAMVLLASLTDDKTLESWNRVDEILVRMVGEQDNAELPPIREGVKAWAADLDAYATLDDADIKPTVTTLLAGTERITSELLRGGGSETADRPGNFYLMGQRFVMDSDVLGQVVYDKLTDGSGQPIKRLEPSVMDVQFALGSNAAGALLRPELMQWGYQGKLHELRSSFDALPDGEWGVSIYRGWLGAIRSLNFNETPQLRPEPFQTKAWQHKVLNTQLASWAELRRDNILYAKQSFTAIPSCEFPDVYVEPEPQFFAAMARLHDIGGRMVAVAPASKRKRLQAFFERGAEISRRLESIANDELSGTKRPRADQLFLKRLIDSKWESEDHVCTRIDKRVSWDGWYTELFYTSDDAFEFEPIIADVHTTPADSAGNTIGRVLHAATAHPRVMVMTIADDKGDSCAFIGPVSQYRTVVTDDFKRLDDEKWDEMLMTGKAPGPQDWQRDFMPK